MDLRGILKNNIVHAIAVVFGVIASFFFLVIPLQERIRMENEETQKFYSRVEHDQKKLMKLSELEAQYKDVQRDEQRVSLLLPESNVVEFIKSVEEIAAALGGQVEISQGTEFDTKKKNTASKNQSDSKASSAREADAQETLVEKLPWEKRISLRVTFSGPYLKASNFLHKIETMPYRIDVLALDIRPIDPEREKDVREADAFQASSQENQVVPSGSNEPSVTALFDIVVYLK